MKKDSFFTLIDSFKAVLMEKEVSMEERLWTNWREIIREDYEFKRKEKELELLDKINLKEF